jgi:hypothetical protein
VNAATGFSNMVIGTTITFEHPLILVDIRLTE